MDGVGVDVGSTTAKIAVVRGGAVVHRAYARHFGRCREHVLELLAKAGAREPRGVVRVTGSVGGALAAELGGEYVHEAHAVAAAVRARFPLARTVVELGGQDAKMLHFEGDALSAEMNERCAAGTGATLDRCLPRVGLDAAALGAFALPEQDLPAVSAKCGVFAEADVVGLVKAGVSRQLVVAALLDAIVRGNLAVLARGRPLPPQVVLLGGPHAFVPALAALWRKHLAARWRERGIERGGDADVVVPEHAAFFAAEGALLAERPGVRLSPPAAAPGRREGPGLAPRSSAPLADGSRDAGEGRARAAPGPLALGIDAGSTTIKAIVIDSSDAVVHLVYRKADRSPLEDAQAAIADLARLLGGDASRVASAGVTGYAADVLAPVFGADASPVETLAHARAARRFVPEADVVCDVGGQDIKVLVLEGDSVRDARLSHQCAAGNGALLEAVARDLGVPMRDWAEVAFSARRAPVLSVGCAVFLDTERVTCQREGFTPAEILAGFARVLPRNVWENVAAAPDLSALGRVFVLSGGVQRNAAAVSAQVEYIRARHPGADVRVHPHAAHAGAIGAALAGRDAARGATRFVGLARALELGFETRSDASTRCGACPSACARTFVEARAQDEAPLRFVTGHACERGAEALPARASRPSGARNLLRVEDGRLFEAPRLPRASSAARGLRVAIPRVLCMYRSAPLFVRYFGAIGAEVTVGGHTTDALWRRAAGRGTVDACFPVKAAYAHVADALRRPDVDVVFYPVLTHAVTAVRGCTDSASCPIVAGTPLAVRAAFEADAARLLTPTLTLTRPAAFSDALFDAARRVAPRLSRGEHDSALAAARAAQQAFEQDLERDGETALERARRERKAAVVLLARPYHSDPGLHHDIGSELWALGRTTMSIRALPKRGPELDLSEAAPFLTNSGDGEKLASARVVAAERWLVAIELSSFKCGQDASLYGAIADLARRGGKPFLALHDLDETRPVASLRLRLRTFLDAVERWEARA